MINPDTGVKKESKDRLFQCPPLPLIWLQTEEAPPARLWSLDTAGKVIGVQLQYLSSTLRP